MAGTTGPFTWASEVAAPMNNNNNVARQTRGMRQIVTLDAPGIGSLECRFETGH
jgi:hypothetical protein